MGHTASAKAPEVASGGEPGAAVDIQQMDLPRLFHRLNNQLGIILANAELLEGRLASSSTTVRPRQGNDRSGWAVMELTPCRHLGRALYKGSHHVIAD